MILMNRIEKKYMFRIISWKKFLYRLIIFAFPLLSLFYACNSESSQDCFQSTGEITRNEISVPIFTKITVFEKVEVILKNGTTQKVEIETGENLMNEVSAMVEGDRLIVKNGNGCNLFRDYGVTKVYITSPNITEIRSSTGLPIRSDGTLSYPTINLLSESFNVPEAETVDGEFNLQLDSQNVNVVVNGIAYFHLVGKAVNLNLVIAAGDSRIEAEDLLVENVSLNHRGSNDMLINPQLSITGVIRGTGDVVSFNRPAAIEIEEKYKGRLLFK